VHYGKRQGISIKNMLVASHPLSENKRTALEQVLRVAGKVEKLFAGGGNPSRIVVFG